MAWCRRCRAPLPPSCVRCDCCGVPDPFYTGTRSVGRPPSVRYPPGGKRALLIGVAYTQSHRQDQLLGADNDVDRVRFLLHHRFNFPPECINVLCDKTADRSRWPTRANIEMAMRELVWGCQRDDSLVFYFSGHGRQLPDVDGDETDGLDEALCPMDHENPRVGVITDDRIHHLMVEPLCRGVKLHAIVDACNSGTVLDLPFVCRMNWDGDFQWREASCVYKGTSGGRAICLSASKDSQPSAQIPLPDGKLGGPMTYYFVDQAMKWGLTYRCLLLGIRRKMWQNCGSLPQVAQLTSSREFDVDLKIFNL